MHPVPPVLDETRGMVLKHNATSMRVGDDCSELTWVTASFAGSCVWQAGRAVAPRRARTCTRATSTSPGAGAREARRKTFCYFGLFGPRRRQKNLGLAVYGH